MTVFYYMSIIFLLIGFRNSDKEMVFLISIIFSMGMLIIALVEEFLTDRFINELLRKDKKGE